MPLSDPAKRQAYNAAYKRRNRHRFRDRQKLYDAARHANERAAKYGSPGVLTPEDVETILASRTCHWCGRSDLTGRDLTVDHIVGLHDKSATNTRDNLAPSCSSCNARKRRAAEPGRWASSWNECQLCGGMDSPHAGKGVCRRCWQRERRRRLRGG